MISSAIKLLQQRQQTITEQIKGLQVEAGKLDKAIQVLAGLSEAAPKGRTAVKAPKARKRKMSAAGRKAIAAGVKARWAAIRAKKAGKAAPAKAKAAKAAKAPAKRAQNKLSLMDAVLKVLEVGKAKSIPEIIAAVKKNGYESKSKTFASMIGQTLKKAGEKVIRVKRGAYALNG